MTSPNGCVSGASDGNSRVFGALSRGGAALRETIARAALFPAREAEGINIGEAMRRLARRKQTVLDQSYLEEVHKRMFGDVWRWAGSYRKSPRNIGIDAYRIPVELRQAIDDARYWIEHGTYSPDEIAVRFSHKVVTIHPFPNGDGRFSRQVGDMLAIELGQPTFTWGQNAGLEGKELRARYVAALKAADAHDIGPLLKCARS